MKYLRIILGFVIIAAVACLYFYYYLPEQQKSLSPLSALPVPFLSSPSPLASASPSNQTGVTTSSEETATSTNKISTSTTIMQFNPAKQYIATLKTTDGSIVIALNRGETPKTVENFITLAEKHFYDKTIFHRVIKGFMIQGGDPTGTGRGGPGYTFADEPFTGSYTRGTVAMANSGPNTNGSQFFIMQDTVALPHNYVIFGHVIHGLNVVDAIADAPVEASATGELSKPVHPVSVESATISVQ